MHITLETDYAIRIVDCLARSGVRMGAQSIAEQSGVTLRFSLKILRKLVGAKIIRSFKGAQGGYEIARPLSEISIYDVVETIEGPYAFSRCLNADHACYRNTPDTPCVYHLSFEKITRMVQEQLRAMTFDHMLADSASQIRELVYSATE